MSDTPLSVHPERSLDINPQAVHMSKPCSSFRSQLWYYLLMDDLNEIAGSLTPIKERFWIWNLTGVRLQQLKWQAAVA